MGGQRRQSNRWSASAALTGAGPIWHDFMQEALKGQPVQDFARPAGLIDLEVCATSGLLPTPYCPYTKREVFIAGTQPTQPDNLYQPRWRSMWRPACRPRRTRRAIASKRACS